MSIGIDELMDMLSWNNDEETQKKGREIAKNVKCYSVFLQPRGEKHSMDVWDNCARILCNHSDDVLQSCFHGMLEWIAEVNNPGEEIIRKRLIRVQDTRLLAIEIEHCVKEALACDLDGWLGAMSELLENERLKEYLSPFVYKVLFVRYEQGKRLCLTFEKGKTNK